MEIMPLALSDGFDAAQCVVGTGHCPAGTLRSNGLVDRLGHGSMCFWC
jgi:hypothetical protein